MHMKNLKDRSYNKDISFKCKHVDTYLYKSTSYYDPKDLKKFNTNIITKIKSMTINDHKCDLNHSLKHSIKDFILKEII